MHMNNVLLTIIMDFVKNVKISATFASKKPIKRFIDIATTRNVYCAQKRNILVIKDIYSITIFQKLNNKYHLNITGIKSLNIISEVINWIIRIYCDKIDFRLIAYNIDNITSAFDIKQKISLHTLANNVKHSSYNPERFHALYFKNDKGTVVVFQSGKINIVGAKSLENILSLWKYIQKEINVAVMNII